jgi:uncharacterized protein (TIGR02466 family)
MPSVIEIFPTTIFIDENKECANRLLPLANEFLKDTSILTNTWGYTNTFGSFQKYQDKIAFFESFLNETSSKYLEICGFHNLELRPDIFFSHMKKGDLHPQHNHPNSILSGVFYLDVADNASCVRFYDPCPERSFFKLPVKEYNSKNWEWYKIQPESGMILIWPSWLKHDVMEITEDSRITAVFNLVL